jgi:hypothetical protein
LLGVDAEQRREEIQKLLPWFEGYDVNLMNRTTRLELIEAFEDIDCAVS